MGSRALAIGLLVAGLVAASCGPEPSSEPVSPAGPTAPTLTIPAAALPGAAAEPVALDVATLASDASEPADQDELEAVLAEAGFVTGVERLFSRTIPGRRRATVRVLAFETAAGAERYVAWVLEHPDALIGEAEADPTLGVPSGGAAFVHEPNPCCHNDSRILLAVWADGSTVFTLEVGGPSARRADVPKLLERLEAAVA